MKAKVILLFLSIIFSLFIFEIVLRALNIVPEVNSRYQRHDIGWTEKNVVLNSAGYRTGEYPRDRTGDTFRAYVVGDSYTYGWFVNNPNDVYPAIIEKGLSKQLNKKVEVINAGAPGFSTNEAVQRYISEGKFYHPDLVILGVNPLRVPVTGGFAPIFSPPLPELLKNTAVYQILFGNIFRKIAENQNQKYLESIFDNENSKDWQEYSKMVLKLRDEAAKINSKLALIIFPHIYPKEPNKPYAFYQYNKRFADFGKKNGILVFDPLPVFLKYQHKENLIINPLDAHPTPQMNKLAADAFLKGFDVKSYILNKKPYIADIETVTIDKNNRAIGKYGTIRRIYSADNASYVYYEIKEGSDVTSVPLMDKRLRQTNYYEDTLQTSEGFTADNIIGGSALYYIKPKQNGEIMLPGKIYGYEVAGFEYIYGIINADTAISAQYINPVSITKSGDNFLIKYDKNKNYYIFTLSIPVKAKQLDIDSNGNVKNILETVFLNKTMEEDSNNVTFVVEKTISGFPQFLANEATTFSYAFVDDKFTKIKDINYDSENKKVTVTFDSTLKKNQKVSLPVSASYELSDGEQISIEVER